MLNVVLDGEMFVFNPNTGVVERLGALQTALSDLYFNPYSPSSLRPLYRVFDFVHVNDQPAFKYTLRDRRNVLKYLQPILYYRDTPLPRGAHN